MVSITLLSTVLFSSCVLSVPMEHAPIQRRMAPPVPTLDLAKTYINRLMIAPHNPVTGYQRDLFPILKFENTCSLRDIVLHRDGENVKSDEDCRPVSGKWTSPFDGNTWYDSEDVTVDHVVPLRNAWKSGAAEWDAERRKAFANDLTNPELWAMTKSLNSEKGDQGPEEWMPPKKDFHCTYAKAWIAVKYFYKLTITEPELVALLQALKTCYN